MASAFFYGTLMHPKILKRVLGNDASHLRICPAILTVRPFLPRLALQLTHQNISQDRITRGTKSRYVALDTTGSTSLTQITAMGAPAGGTVRRLPRHPAVRAE
jgi:hypothetical protein